jgi:DNA (cytosine-5)-methyltransferase 3A
MSCGQIALEKAGIKVNNYFASEIKKHAIKCTQTNYPNTIQVGDITKLKATDLPKIDLVIGGSPCQDISHLKPNSKGVYDKKSKLFFEYLRLLLELKPKYFLLENVNGKKESIELITKLLGVEPIKINSSLVSFQNRVRLYWTNIPGVKQPKDKQISFQDFKELEADEYKVNYTPSRITMWGDGVNGKCPNITHREKINCLTCKQDRWNNAGLIEYDDFCRYLTVKECELAQNVPIGYTNCVSKNQAWDLLGDGWTVDIIVGIFNQMALQKPKREGEKTVIAEQ